MSEIVYSNYEELQKAAREQGLIVPQNQALEDPSVPINSPTTGRLKFEDLPEDILGEQVANLMQRYQTHGYVPTFKEAIAYRKFMAKKEASFIQSAGDAISQTTSDLIDATTGFVGDALTLKLPKVLASPVEGAALGTKNWFYMYEQAKYDEHSFLSKMLYGNHANDEDYYENLKKTIELNKLIEKDRTEGILLPPKIKVGDTEIDLTNPAVVQGISYVADPSWAVPNLGIEAAIAKSLRGATSAVRLGEQLTKASVYASKKAATGFGKLADNAGGVANAVQTINDSIAQVFKDATSYDHYIQGTGRVAATDAIARNAESSLGMGAVAKIPLWPVTTGVWGVAKVVEGIGVLGEAVGKNAFDPSTATAGLTLSERVAQSSGGKVATVSNFYSKSVSPLTQWMGQTAKTALHSGMYGGAFGLAFGGEEGMYHGFGTGIVLGSAFHQVGVFANAVQGGDRYRTVLKNFLWATEHYDKFNQEGVFHLMERVVEKKGEEGRYSLMSQIAAFERIHREEKMFILKEERLREMQTAEEFADYQKMLDNPEFGGVTFTKVNGENVILINADRAVKSAVSEELFHTLAINKRYKTAFVKHTVENLIGTEDAQGALYRMPKERAVSILEQFRDQYFGLDKETAGHIPQIMEENYRQFNDAIQKFKAGERPTTFRGFFEEFLASYWNRFVDDKPIDYLLKGGDLGLIRNAIEWGKDLYRDIMRVDLSEAGVQFKTDATPDAFLIDQNTKQRIRVPMLEGLMKHYVKEIRAKMYDGWEVNKNKYKDTFTLFNQQLEHLIVPEDLGKAEARVNPDGTAMSITQGLQAAIERLQTLAPPNRSGKFELISDKGVTLASFQPAFAPPEKKGKPKKTVGQLLPKPQRQDFWRTLPKSKKGAGVTREEIREIGGRKKGQEATEKTFPATEEGEGGWTTDKGAISRGEFWESVWQGNPRIKISGVLSSEEVKIFKEYLPENVVRRLVELNQIIERAKVDQLKNISNIVKAVVITKTKENEDGSRKRGHFMSARRFVPLELNLYFERTKKNVNKKSGEVTYEVGEANLMAMVMDWDAILTREDYAFNKVDDEDLNYKTVRRLFGTRAELREAVKALLANYSLGNKAQAGIKLFSGGKGGERDAALKRDIVNAVIGFHPTRAMENANRGWYNEPRTMQLRQKGNKRTLPTVVTNFNVDLIGRMVVEDGEGFRYNHDEAYKRGQANFSPAITHRDHEGHPMPSYARSALADTRYRNKEGEVISVYSLRTPLSEIVVNENANKIYDIVAEDLVDAMQKKGAVRGHMYSSPSGWLHFTADAHEAGYTTTGKLRTGYINTKKHLDISDIGNAGSYKSMVVEIGKRINELTGVNATEVVKEILRLDDIDGNNLYSIFKAEDNILNAHIDTIESWLFTPQSRKVFEKYGIDSVEYRAVNPNSGSNFSAVAIFAPDKFVENRNRHGLEQYQFSPAKSVEESLRKQIAKTGGDGSLAGLLKYRIDEYGEPVPNTSRITSKTLDDIVKLNKMLVADAEKAIKSGGLLDENSRKAYEQTLVPYVINELKRKFPRADKDVLRQIAEHSLKGFVSYVEMLPKVQRKLIKPFGAESSSVVIPRREVRSNSAFIETALKMGITPEALMETGIPSLGHWMEMSQAEFETLKNWPKVVSEIANQEKKQREANIAALKEVNQYEAWLADFRKTNKNRRSSAQVRAEGEVSVQVDARRRQLAKELITGEEAEAILRQEFKGYNEVIKKNQARMDKLRAQEDEKFSKLSSTAQTLYNIPKGNRKEFLKNSETRTTSQLGIIKKVLADNNGITGLMDNLAQRQRELFFLMDETMGGPKLGEKFTLSSFAKNKLKEQFIYRTRQFVAQQMKLGPNASLKKIKEAFDTFIEAGRDIPTEAAEAMAVLIEHERKAEAIISQDNIDRIMDIMAAYSIKELDVDILEQVRAKVYDEASQGFYAIGSPEAIARSVELYAVYDGGQNKRYIDVRKTIKENFVKALDDLERKGFRGVYWSEVDTSRTKGIIQLGGRKFTAQHALRFEGTNFYLIRRRLSDALIEDGHSRSKAEAINEAKNNAVFELVDGEGNTIDRVVYDQKTIGQTPEQIKSIKTEFLRRATSLVNKLSPEMSIANGKFQTVEGAVKEFVLLKAVKASGRGVKDLFEVTQTVRDTEIAILADEGLEAITDTEIATRWELFRNGDVFLAYPVIDQKTLRSGRTVEQEIQNLKGQIKSGVVVVPAKGKTPETTRPMTTDEKVNIRQKIVDLQKDAYYDYGFSFRIDDNYDVEVIDSNFRSLQHREEALGELKINGMRGKSFEKFLQKSYASFDKKLQALKDEHAKRIQTVLSEKDKRGAIPQIRELLHELHQLESVNKKFITNEMLAYNRANKERGTGRKQSVDSVKMRSLLRDRLDNFSRSSKQAELQYLAVAEQMRKYGLLEKSEGFTPEMVEALEARVDFADQAELAQNMLPEQAKRAPTAEWASNLRVEFRKRLAEWEFRERQYQQLQDNLYGRDEASEKILDKIEFLVDRYMQARGYRNVDTGYYLKKSTDEGMSGYTDLKWKELKAGTPEGVTGFGEDKTKTEPLQKQEGRYLPDKAGVLDSPLPDDFKFPEELIAEFNDGIKEASDQWHRGKTKGDLGLDDILRWGRESADSETSTSGALIRGLSNDKFDATELAWLNNPENKTQVAEFHSRWAKEEATPPQIISEIKDAVLASTVGRDGIQLRDTVNALNETIRKIGVVSDRLRIRHGVEIALTPKEMENPYAARARARVTAETDPIHTYRQGMPDDVGKLYDEIDSLRKQKVSLEARYNAILKKASGKYANPEFRKMVQQMKGEDVRQRIARKNTASRRAEEKILQKQLAASEKELFKMYDDIAKNMRFQNPELVFENSRIEVHPRDPRTQYLFYSFGALSWDFFGSNWQIDLTLTTTGRERPLGVSAERGDLSSTESPIVRQVNKNERANRRRIFLADYIHYAVNKRRFHERNPSEPMSAMDANLFGVLFKRDIQNGLFKEKISKIPAEQMQMQEAMNQGIVETFSSPDEKSRFIRSFVVDALDLISTDKSLREKAFMNLKGINYEQFKKLRAENPKYVEQALDTLEVVEKAMYLIKDGNVPVGELGEKLNVRDSVNLKFTIEENLLIRRAEAANGLAAGTVRRILNGQVTGIELPQQVKRMIGKKKQPFLTRSNIGFVPVDTLIRMDGFDSIWKEHMADEGYNTALFALDGMWNVKKAYEQMPPQERMALQTSRINRLLLENRAGQMQAAKEAKERYRKRDKAILAPDSMQTWAYGKEDSIAKDEFSRVDEILKTAMSVEATIQRYKGDAVSFVNKRPFALDHLLSLNDNLRIDGAKRNKDRTLSVDWDNPDKPQWRDTIDGRYFIKRMVNAKGKESFKVYFKGQTFKTAEGVLVGDIGITSFATVENLTQAQVSIRFFEDDIKRVTLSSRLIKGGTKRFEPLAVGEKTMPVQNVDKLFTVWDEVPAFSERILDLYMENKGTPFFREQMAEKLAGIGQYGETVYIRDFKDGKWGNKRIFITPREEGVYSQYFEKTTSPDGHTMYIRKKDSIQTAPEPVNLGSDQSTSQAQATETAATPKPDKVEQAVSDSSNWDVIEMDKSDSGDFPEWSIIKNKLGYTLMRLKNPATQRSVFRLFNPASAFMAETHHEIDAMEEILKKELGKL